MTLKSRDSRQDDRATCFARLASLFNEFDESMVLSLKVALARFNAICGPTRFQVFDILVPSRLDFLAVIRASPLRNAKVGQLSNADIQLMGMFKKVLGVS